MSSRDAKVEHDGGNDRRAHSEWAHSAEPSETTAGASRLMRWGGGDSRGGEKTIYIGQYHERVEQVGGINRQDRPTEVTDGASRLMGRGGNKARWTSRGHDKSCRNTD